MLVLFTKLRKASGNNGTAEQIEFESNMSEDWRCHSRLLDPRSGYFLDLFYPIASKISCFDVSADGLELRWR